MTRVLIFDGAAAAWQRELADLGAPTNAELFVRALALHAPDVTTIVQNVADGERLPAGVPLGSFDGAVIPGSPLNLYAGGEAVTRQLGALREVFAAGVPVYGSCWGMQLGAAALGGAVRLNPHGREIGIGRRIALTPEGRSHALFANKADVFDALSSHQDEVSALPDGARVLAANRMSRVQAFTVETQAARFWGVQYHPEHTFGYIAAVMDSRRESLVAEGFARAPAELDGMVADFRALDDDPGRGDLAWRHGLDAHVLDPALRTAEIGNWLRSEVLPRRARRAAAA